MDNRPIAPHAHPAATGSQQRRLKPLRAIWRGVRRPLANSQLVKRAIAGAMAQGMRFIRLTSPLAEGSSDFEQSQIGSGNVIYAMWHGQHLMAPAFYSNGRRMVAMVSRSADAELNALVLESFGIEVIRGSGGREGAQNRDKGGAKALIALKKALADGSNVFMIADIPNGAPRQAGIGVLTLARISGRPIIPAAVVTSRRKRLESSWDKMTINLPFGRSAVVLGDPIQVPTDADEATLETKRLEVNAAIDGVNARAYAIVDGAR